MSLHCTINGEREGNIVRVCWLPLATSHCNAKEVKGAMCKSVCGGWDGSP